MKITILFVLLYASSSHAQIWRRRLPASDPPPSWQEIAAQKAAALKQAQYYFIPKDPWRIIGSKRSSDLSTNYAKGITWIHFAGTVVDVGNGVIGLRGWFGAPCDIENGNTNRFFWVKNFPYKVKLGQIIYAGDRYCAQAISLGESEATFDYWKVTKTPGLPDPTQPKPGFIESTDHVLSQAEVAAKTLAWQKELADKGDPYGQYKMGMRYMTGDGVEKDTVKAREFLIKASAQGCKDADEPLSKLASK